MTTPKLQPFVASCIAAADQRLEYETRVIDSRGGLSPFAGNVVEKHHRFVDTLVELDACGYAGRDVDDRVPFHNIVLARLFPEEGVEVQFFMGLPSYWIHAKLSGPVYGETRVEVSLRDVHMTVPEVESFFRRSFEVMHLEKPPVKDESPFLNPHRPILDFHR